MATSAEQYTNSEWEGTVDRVFARELSGGNESVLKGDLFGDIGANSGLGATSFLQQLSFANIVFRRAVQLRDYAREHGDIPAELLARLHRGRGTLNKEADNSEDKVSPKQDAVVGTPPNRSQQPKQQQQRAANHVLVRGTPTPFVRRDQRRQSSPPLSQVDAGSPASKLELSATIDLSPVTNAVSSPTNLLLPYISPTQQEQHSMLSDLNADHLRTPGGGGIASSFLGGDEAMPSPLSGHSTRHDVETQSDHLINSRNSMARPASPNTLSANHSGSLDATSFSWDEHTVEDATSPLAATRSRRGSVKHTRDQQSGTEHSAQRNRDQDVGGGDRVTQGLQFRRSVPTGQQHSAQVVQPTILRVVPKRHQRQAVRWMQAREAGQSPNDTAGKSSPHGANSNVGTARGGILADDTGMGKTTTALVLVAQQLETCRANRAAALAAQFEELSVNNATISGRCGQVREPACRPVTLVVVPLSVLGQWRAEVRSKTGLAVYVHHGPGRVRRPGSLQARLQSCDLVVTTYSLLTQQECTEISDTEKLDCSCFCARRSGVQHEDDPAKGWTGVHDNQATDSMPSAPGSSAVGGRRVSLLHRVRWERVILDEAHLIANPQTRRAQAARALNANCGRWCLTATPVQNHGFRDLVGLFRFIGVPRCEYEAVSSSRNGGRAASPRHRSNRNRNVEKQRADDQMAAAVGCYMLRRLKDSTATNGVTSIEFGAQSSHAAAKRQRQQTNVVDSQQDSNGKGGVSPLEKRLASRPTPIRSAAKTASLHIEIPSPKVSGGPGKRDLRTKAVADDNVEAANEALDFPEVHESVKTLHFQTDFENEFYRALEASTRSNLAAALAAQQEASSPRRNRGANPLATGLRRLGRVSTEAQQESRPVVGTMHVFDWLTKCRQFCCHPSLVYKSMVQTVTQASAAEKNADKAAENAAMAARQAQRLRQSPKRRTIRRGDVSDNEDAIIAAAEAECTTAVMEAGALELEALQTRDVAQKYRECFSQEQWDLFAEMCGGAESGKSMSSRTRPSFTSTKVAALIRDLRAHYQRHKSHHRNTKFVVLTTWTSFVRVIAVKLRREGYHVGELHGALSDGRRRTLLEALARDDDGARGCMQGLVATLGTAGVGKWLVKSRGGAGPEKRVSASLTEVLLQASIYAMYHHCFSWSPLGTRRQKHRPWVGYRVWVPATRSNANAFPPLSRIVLLSAISLSLTEMCIVLGTRLGTSDTIRARWYCRGSNGCGAKAQKNSGRKCICALQQPCRGLALSNT